VRAIPVFLSLMLLGAAAAPAADPGYVDCTMKFSLKGWSVFYKTAEGSGTVTCSNGQKASVRIKVKGGGLSFGKSEIAKGTGKFSDLKDISEIYGGYVAAEAHAGAGKSVQAAVYTKGEVSLALAGKGRGVNIGWDFGKLTILRPGDKD
jgi:hypothetical protein